MVTRRHYKFVWWRDGASVTYRHNPCRLCKSFYLVQLSSINAALLLDFSILFVIWFCFSKFITIVASLHPTLTNIFRLMNPRLFSRSLGSPNLFCHQLSNTLYCLDLFCLLVLVLGSLPIRMKSTSPKSRK